MLCYAVRLEVISKTDLLLLIHVLNSNQIYVFPLDIIIDHRPYHDMTSNTDKCMSSLSHPYIIMAYANEETNRHTPPTIIPPRIVLLSLDRSTAAITFPFNSVLGFIVSGLFI